MLEILFFFLEKTTKSSNEVNILTFCMSYHLKK